MPPPSSGGVGLLEMLNVLEGYDLKAMGFASATQIHLMAESMKRAYADRAKYPRRSRLQHGHADRSADVEGVLRRSPQDDQPGQGGEVVADDVRLAARERRDDAHLGGGREPQRGVDDLHARAGLRREDRRAGRRLPAEQRDGRLQRRAGDDQRQGLDRHQAEPRRAGQADALQHDADDPRQGRQAVHGQRQPGRPHHHQHRARDDRRRRRLRHERAGSGRRGALPPSVAARRDQLRAVRLLARHDQGARAPRPHAARRRRPGRRAGDHLRREGGHARRRQRSPRVGRRARSACPGAAARPATAGQR